MKMIHKNNFIPIVCICFTLLSIGKVILETIILGKFGNEQQNLVLMLLLSVLAVAVLSQHYRFGSLPLTLVILVQYMLSVSVVMLITWISSFFETLHKDAYRDMFLSFTIPYVIGAVIYYVSLFFEIKHANKTLEEIRRYQVEEAN